MWIKVRELASSWKYQTLLKAGTYTHVQLFDNVKDFSKIQLYFLHWWIIAQSLFERFAMGDEHLNEAVLKDSIRIDAYLYCETLRKADNHETSLREKLQTKQNIDEDHPESFEFVFLTPKKKGLNKNVRK